MKVKLGFRFDSEVDGDLWWFVGDPEMVWAKIVRPLGSITSPSEALMAFVSFTLNLSFKYNL